MKKLRSIVITVTLVLLVIQTLHAQDIFDAARSGDFEKVRELVGKDPQMVNAKNAWQNTPLHIAVSINNEAMTMYFIEKGADINAANRNGWTPLFFASNVSLAEIVIEKGADIDYGYPHYTPIISALGNNCKDVAEYLLKKGAKLPNIGTPYSSLSAIYALKIGSLLYLEKCLQQGFNPLYENEGKNNLLHYASEGNSIELIEKLISIGLPLSKPNIFGFTPLHIAAFKGNSQVVKHLIKKGAEVNARTKDGRTPLNLATEAKKSETIKYLKSIGADQDPQRFPVLTGEYIGQPKPGSKAVPFAPGIVSGFHPYHGSIVFTPDGNQLFWSVGIESESVEFIFTTKIINGKWTKPEFFSKGDVPFISPDGKRLFFIGRKQINGNSEEIIYVRDKTLSGWSEPHELPDIINGIPGIHWQVSVDRKGNLYFGARGKIYHSEYLKGNYTNPVAIESLNDLRVFSPCISPDGSFLLSTKEGEGEQLIILFKERDGTWSKPIEIADQLGINTAFCPTVTPDEKYLFFISGLGDLYAPYWVDAGFIEELKPKE